METRKLGNTDLALSLIGLGTWAMGGNNWKYGWGPQDDSDSIRCIHQALDEGINWVDVAPAYGLGHAEEILGKALKQTSRKPLIATKCGLFQDKKGEIFSRLKPASIRKEIEESLRRLDLPVIDLYQIHWPNPSREVEEAFVTLLDLKKEGKIRHVGVCNFSCEQLSSVAKLEMPTSLQSPYSAVVRDMEKNIVPWCQERHVSVLAYSPLQCGLLSGKISRAKVEAFPKDDWRKEKSAYFRDPLLSKILEFLGDCYAFVKEKLPEAQSPLILGSLQWLLSRPGVTSAIVGMRNNLQLEEILQAMQTKVNAELLLGIDNLSIKYFGVRQ